MAKLLDIKVDINDALRGCKIVREEQLPFTIARALTMTAVEARDDLRNLESNVFALRNDWTQRRTLTKMATKTDLTAQVYTDTENRKTGAPDYLPRQEDGGVKRPYGSLKWQGVAYIAVPTVYLAQLIGPGPIPEWAKAINLIKGSQNGKRTYWSGKKEVGNLRQLRAAMREWVVNGHVFFVNERRGTEKPAIFARLPGHRYPIQPIYLLIQEAHLKARFAATPEVEEIVQANFDKFFTQAATEVAANDLLRGTGVRVKL